MKERIICIGGNIVRRTAFCLFLLLNLTYMFAQGYKNPVLPGFHADPSVCRWGDDFYLVNSTFQYFPGVPVYHSKDLVNWQQIGHCITRRSQADISGMDETEGIYAPTIRCHNGRFYMVTTIYPSRKHFYVWTDNPSGEWSEPIVIDFAVGSCDPTLFFDDNGKCYFLWKEGEIKICEINVETGEKIGDIYRLWSGLGGRYPEGPHIYKKDGYYYLMLSEGGTEHGHSVTIARSKYLLGPYESNPANPILTHFNMKMQESEIQGVGHADLVQAPDNSWWMICLGYRTSGYLQHVMGRETFLAPVRWDTGAWPVVNSDGTLQTNMKCKTLPLVPMPKEPAIDEFEGSKLACYWSFLNIPDSTNYSLDERRGFLRLRPSEKTLDEKSNPTFIGRRQTEKNFIATALFDVSGIGNKTQAGITAYAARLNHYDVIVNCDEAGNKSVQAVVRIGQSRNVIAELPLDNDKVYLRIDSDSYFYNLSFSVDNKTFVHLGKMEYRYLSTETVGGFCGVHIGVYAQSPEPSGYVDVDYFEYNTK